MNTFDLKGSRFHRKAVKDYAYKQLLSKAYEYDFGIKKTKTGISDLTDIKDFAQKKECDIKFLKSLQSYTLKDNDFESLTFSNKLKINMS